MHQSIDAFLDADKDAEVGDVPDGTVDDGAHRVPLLDHVPGVGLELTHAEAAKRIGKSREYVSNYLRLLKLAEPVQKLVNERLLSLGHAKALAGLPLASQRGMAMDAVSGGWSVRVLESRCRSALKRPAAGDALPRRDAQWQALERDLTDKLGNKVSIDFDGTKGELRVAFHSLDEFDGILQRLGVQTSGE